MSLTVRPPAAFGFADAPPGRTYLGLALAYAAVYLSINSFTLGHNVGDTSITLWSPDNALSVMLIMASWTYTPVVWAAQVGSDLLFGHVGSSAAASICAETTITAGYLGIGMALKRGFGLDLRAMQPRDLMAVMAVAPLGAAITGLAYCGALLGLGEMKATDFVASFSGFWIGDATAMVILIPASAATMRAFAESGWRRPGAALSLLQLTAILMFLAWVVYLSTSNLEQRYLLNLAYLPILLVGIKFGYDASALALLLLQSCLIAALSRSHVPESATGAYQLIMFVLAISGQTLSMAVTEWESAKAQLRRQQAELAKVSERATNGVLAAAMSHEISQPLASLAAFVLGARRLLESGQGQERALAALRKAEGEAARARAIVERLRDFVAKGAVAPELVDLRELVDTIVRLEDDAAREREVRLAYEVEPAPLRALADRVGLEQALANLIVNAIEATPAGGEVRVGLRRQENRAVLSVEDDGPGVAEEIADRLFEPFETTKPRGMGLGLPLAKEIVARHGGRLGWRPASPHGACFELELPLA